MFYMVFNILCLKPDYSSFNVVKNALYFRILCIYIHLCSTLIIFSFLDLNTVYMNIDFNN